MEPLKFLNSLIAGKDYSNPLIRDFYDLSKWDMDSLDRWTQPRLPWHDLAICLIGQSSRDIARHFIQVTFFIAYYIYSPR
jgi:phosphatidylserine/phosphatidylglycerophosphate/cardiolipin synthase-like enzyme